VASSNTTSTFPIRWIVVPAVGWAVVTAAIAIFQRRARQPNDSRMSDDWLRSNELDLGRKPTE
jgi:hypothetical protein